MNNPVVKCELCECIFENYSAEQNVDIHTLVDKCSHFNVNFFKYFDDKTFGFENDIDSDNNFYKKKRRDCHSYTLLAELDLQFDIIAISETSAELDLINDYNINNYNGYHITRGYPRGGGVAIYTSKELSCKLFDSRTYMFE